MTHPAPSAEPSTFRVAVHLLGALLVLWAVLAGLSAVWGAADVPTSISHRWDCEVEYPGDVYAQDQCVADRTPEPPPYGG